MTQQDADRLKEQLDRLTLAQWKLFWRWITYAYFDCCRQATAEEIRAARAVLTTATPATGAM